MDYLSWLIGLFFIVAFRSYKTFTVEGVTANKFCDLNRFYNPYVEVLKRRGGYPTAGLYESGFLDLRLQYGVLLCLNGPAVIYNDVEYKENVTRKEMNVTFLKRKDDIKFYSHECIIINRPSELQENNSPSDVVGVDDADRMTFHRLMNYPTSEMTPETKLLSDENRVYGVTLIGAKGNYREPTLHMFTEPGYQENVQRVLVGSSFAAINENEWICEDKFTNATLTFMPPVLPAPVPSSDPSKPAEPALPKLCCRDQANEVFDTTLRRAHYHQDYVWIKGNKSTGPPPPAATPAPLQDLTANFTELEKLGRLINPAKLGIKFKNHSSHPMSGFGIGAGTEAGAMDSDGAGEGYDPNFPYDFPEDFNPAAEKPHVDAIVQPSDCRDLPSNKEACDKSKDDSSEACNVLHTVLEIDEPEWKGKEFEWKLNVLKLIEDIFIRVCTPISERGGRAIGKLGEKFVFDSHTGTPPSNPTKNSFWDFLITELEHCRNESHPLKFNEIEVESNTQQPGVQSENDLTATAVHVLRTPPKIQVKRKGQFHDIFFYEEAVEVDYEFNLGIDGLWKVFSTVLGYCNQFYSIKKSNIFPRLYSMFADDFLIPLKKDWTDPKLNDVYELVIGEVVGDDGLVWLNACMEGAYVYADSEAYRAMRPLGINEVPDATKSMANHFITVPPHYRR